MIHASHSLRLLTALLCTLPALPAQDAPKPAPELQKLAPLLGNWTGAGKMNEPGGVSTSWSGRGTYRWALDGFWLREDFAIQFEGDPVPIVKHGYLGWDGENKRYVHLVVSSNGNAELHRLVLGDDGSMQTLSLHDHGMSYAQRAIFAVKGDELTHSLELLMPTGPSLAMVDGKFTRGGEAFAGAFDTAAFMGAQPEAALAKLARSAGAYDVKGQVVMGPGIPPMQMKGVDTLRPVFGGMVLHVHTDGVAEGMPGKYACEVFWAHDTLRGCLVGHVVSNMGEVMTMEARWAADGKLVGMASALWMGQPLVQRTLMEFDARGALSAAVAHALLGTAAPYESFRATYTKQG